MTKPDVDKIEGIPPAVAIEQRVNTRNPRSTVGTTTEIYDYLRTLYAKIGKTFSPISGAEVKRESVEDVTAYISKVAEGSAVYILTQLKWDVKKERMEKLLSLKQAGYSRLFVDGEVVRIDEVIKEIEKFSSATVYILISRFIHSVKEDDVSEIRSSLETAFAEGKGHLSIALQMPEQEDNAKNKKEVKSVGNKKIKYREFSNIFEADGMKFEEPTELMFSFNNPIGACPVCGGYGNMVGIDEHLVIPNASLSVYEGAIAPWRGKIMGWYLDQLVENAGKFNFPIHRPYAQLTKEQKDLLWDGNEYFKGINDFFKWVESKKYKIQFRYMLSRYSGKTTCRACGGSRLKKEVTYVKVGGKTIVDLLDMSVVELKKFFENLTLTPYEEKICKRAIAEINQRLDYIINVGLGYLSLSRRSNTLSGGESQRINLVSSLGSSLVGSLYILDEPSIGLHPRDTQRLISVIKKLRDLGNTIVIVEHDADIIRAADELIDIGPLAGVNGGEVVYQGPPPAKAVAAEPGERMERSDFKRAGSSATASTTQQDFGHSLTLQYLSGTKQIQIRQHKRKWVYSINIEGAMEHNLKNINVKFPLKAFTVVTGVSGSGKSSLVGDVLYPALCRHFEIVGPLPGAYRDLTGDLKKLDGVEYIDQNPLGKSARSNPVTYLKIYDDIRKIFSEQPYAKMNGYGHSHFSFNIDGGRCPVCLGDGFITIPMQFMADVRMVCEECGGKRFKPDILEVKYHDKNINDVLNLSVDQAIEFFGAQKESVAQRVAEKLKVLQDVGLGYIQLGQSSSTLSGGESQRVMLAKFLSKDTASGLPGAGGKLFIFDEPTTGLHFNDIGKLLQAFDALVDAGNTIIVVEHNTDVIKAADWIIDLGPDSGDKGGEVVFTGTPEQLKDEPRWKEYLN
ncbi:MAG: excinuclease ABC subunit A [Bacteroidales bacterium]|jgi:excinuclease ABC subunit A|nr:excinuclease ABC subunit A [Bacteroidales bacterium]MCI1734081.1 excinuclease ABC subunit A [Bacteroidales bacterium]